MELPTSPVPISGDWIPRREESPLFLRNVPIDSQTGSQCDNTFAGRVITSSPNWQNQDREDPVLSGSGFVEARCFETVSLLIPQSRRRIWLYTMLIFSWYYHGIVRQI